MYEAAILSSDWSELRTGWIFAHIFSAFTLSPDFCGFKLRSECYSNRAVFGARLRVPSEIRRGECCKSHWQKRLSQVHLAEISVARAASAQLTCTGGAVSGLLGRATLLWDALTRALEMASNATDRACWWVTSRRALCFPFSNIPWFLNRPGSILLFPRDNRR